MHPLSNPNSSRKPIVFYDGGCPLCSREIRHYRKLAGSDNISWVDITSNPRALQDHGLSYDTAMSRFHVLDSNGQWKTGTWGFVELWSHLHGYRWLAKLITISGMQPLLDRIYSHFARKRLIGRCSQAKDKCI